MNIEKAIKFVRDNGDEVDQARLHYILTCAPPSKKIMARHFAAQRSDGGWSAFWAHGYSSLDATCFRLAQAEQLGITASEAAVIRASNFLAQRQFSDGSWEEDQSLAEFAPPWVKPGNLSATLYWTANCGFWLAILDNPENSSIRAAEYLQTHLGADGQLPSFLHAHWLAGGLLYKLNWQESAKRVFEYLSKRVNDLSASNLAWMITTMQTAGVPANHYLVENALILLEQSQHHDGYWENEDGADQNVHSTLEALRALQLCRWAGK